MVVHEQLHSTDIPGLLRGLHLPHEIVHPEHQVSDHREEPEEIVRVVQLGLAAITLSLKFEPSPDNFSFAVGNLHGLVAGVGVLQLGGLSLDRLDLYVQSLKVLDEVLVLSLQRRN